jgi:hypothetical protein
LADVFSNFDAADRRLRAPISTDGDAAAVVELAALFSLSLPISNQRAPSDQGCGKGNIHRRHYVQKGNPSFFVVSSVRNERIWYNRCNRSDGYMNCVLIDYPAEKREWDGVVTRTSHTLTK